MKRMAALSGALLLTLVLAAPAAAGKASTYTVAAAWCGWSGGSDMQEWQAGQTEHLRDTWTDHYDLFLLDDDDWVYNGTRAVTAKVINFVPNKAGYTAQGEIEVRGSLFGDFDGSWMSNSSGVRGTLHGLDGADYDHLKLAVVGQSNVDVFGLPNMPDEVCDPPVAAGEDSFEISTWTLH